MAAATGATIILAGVAGGYGALWPAVIAVATAVGLFLWWRGNGIGAAGAAVFSIVLLGATAFNPTFPLAFRPPLMLVASLCVIASAVILMTARRGRAEGPY